MSHTVNQLKRYATPPEGVQAGMHKTKVDASLLSRAAIELEAIQAELDKAKRRLVAEREGVKEFCQMMVDSFDRTEDEYKARIAELIKENERYRDSLPDL